MDGKQTQGLVEWGYALSVGVMSVHGVVDGKQTQGYTGFGFSLSFKHVRNLVTHHDYFCFIAV